MARYNTIPILVVLILTVGPWAAALATDKRPSGIPAEAILRPDLGTADRPVWCSGSSLFIAVPGTAGQQVAVIPRLPCRLKQLSWLGLSPDDTITLRPEPTEWKIEAKTVPATDAVLVMELLDPVPGELTRPIIVPNVAGRLELPAHFADTHGDKLRFEPQPHKNTIGYWTNPEEWAAWSMKIPRSGEYRLELHQGCGTGQGGSEVDVVIVPDGDRSKTITVRSFVVEETGHFQKFRARDLGTVAFPEAGVYRLEVRPRKLAKNAVMDVRLVTLTPVDDAREENAVP